MMWGDRMLGASWSPRRFVRSISARLSPVSPHCLPPPRSIKTGSIAPNGSRVPISPETGRGYPPLDRHDADNWCCREMGMMVNITLPQAMVAKIQQIAERASFVGGNDHIVARRVREDVGVPRCVLH